jgi:hypothetical protein
MLDPSSSLAFSLYANKGVYALLLGSGISRSAGIPTGWDVTLDLIHQIARLHQEEPDDPEAWYRTKFDEPPSYSNLLEHLVKTQAERQQALKRYFESTEDERANGVKLPTIAHKAIAQLVRDGYIQVVITTNFDRLLEQAIEAEGVMPTVLSTADAVQGALPLQHTTCTVVKIHGDYLDTRMRNTEEELSEYEESFNRLLDRIFDEYGLIVCGWSGGWDHALRAALQRCKTHRFSMYWMSRGQIGDQARQITVLRHATILQIEGADQAFQALTEKVTALAEYNRPHPLSVQSAVAAVKRYIAEDRYRIQLHDLVINETERQYAEMTEENFPVRDWSSGLSPEEEIRRQVGCYEARTEILRFLFAVGCYWSGRQQHSVWIKALQRLSHPQGNHNGYSNFIQLRLYPALLLLYSGGIAAIAGHRYDTLAALLTEPTVHEPQRGRDVPIVLGIYPEGVLNGQLANQMLQRDRLKTPASDYLHHILRDALRSCIPSDQEYDDIFDQFEYLLSLAMWDIAERTDHYAQRKGFWGRFIWHGWRGERFSSADTIAQVVEQQREQWPLLEAGLFGKSLDTFWNTKKEFDGLLRRRALEWLI